VHAHARGRLPWDASDGEEFTGEFRRIVGLGIASRPTSTVEEAMRNGPATFRPNEPVGKMAKRMQDRGARAVLVTTSGGKLVGLLYREDVEHLAGART